MEDTVPGAAASARPATSRRFAKRAGLVFALAMVGLSWRLALYLLTGRPGGAIGFIEAHCVWDCHWYAGIITGGYMTEVGTPAEPESANWAFFPLYPLLAAILVHGTGASPALAGFLLSNLLTIIAAILARPLLTTDRAYWFFVATLMVGPFSVLFSSLYSESLFVLLTVLALLALHRSRYLPAAGWIALMSATRITGVLMVFALAAQVVLDHRRVGGRWRDLPRRVISDTDLLLAIVLAPAGLFAFMAFLWFQTGDALAFAHIQRAWERNFEGPFAAIGNIVAGAIKLGYVSPLQWTWMLVGVAGLVLAYALRLRQRLPEAIFCGLSLLASLSTGVGSAVRFVAGLVPLGMVTAELLTRWRWLAWMTLAAAIVVDAVVTLGWFDSSMVLM